MKGTLDLLILKSLSWHPTHGYEICKRVRQKTDDTIQIETGALYQAVRRLEKRGWVTAEWKRSGTGREARFYALTPAGRSQLQKQTESWQRYVKAMACVLNASEA
jgi:transcriptional regulator